MKYQLCNVKVTINYHALATLSNLRYLANQKMEAPITFFTFGSPKIVAVLMRVDANYGGSKVAKVLVAKIQINEKLTLEWKKMLKTRILNVPYVVINPYNKFHMKDCPSKKLFYHAC
jgi:hypothetical protein